MSEAEKIIYIHALRHYGHHNQMIKTMEECGELIQALAKSWTKEGYRLSLSDHVLEELADVQIMVHQMSLIFGPEEFENMVLQKTSRLSMRIGLEMAQLEKGPK